MRVEILEEKLSDRDSYNDRHYTLVKGDIQTVSDELGKTWCRRGWAKDVDGKVPTGERIVRSEVVEPKSTKHSATDSNQEA